ncbi:hypothetical protein EQG63_09885 [Flavobacterium amnicola]|uniref:Hyaluronidase n=1 Tax=Flavobacterium amnicola TaxID=2506422 RepID=A0A4Q1K1I8_9FLAO|nr:hypothetical protein [Flavobacterium amnicola]RXR17784.1 hypothetical protein EQG63_09885 [Flavobacterium amnicola]
MNKNLTILLLFVLAISCLPKTKHNNRNDVDANIEQKFLYSILDYGDEMKQFAQKNEMEYVNYVDEKMFLSTEEYKIDTLKFKKFISEKFPNKNQNGYCFIDLESPYLEKICNNETTDEDFIKAQQLFIGIVQFAKKTRPNVKWGFYAIPFTTYWETMTGFLDRNDKIDKLLKEVDVFFPSMYMFYDDGIVGTLKNSEYISSNVEKSIELGRKYHKPVYPFVLHRFHPSNEKLGWSLMENSFWEDYINKIVSCEYNRHNVDGIVWWAADTYFYGRKDGMNINKEFKGTKTVYIKYNDKNYIEKAKIVKPLLIH